MKEGDILKEFFDQIDAVGNDELEVEGQPEQHSSYNLFHVDFPPAVKITHKNVERALKDRCTGSGLLEFYSDWTGRGKTSGVILSTGKLFQRGSVKRVLFITREIAGVDDVWRQFAATWPDLNVIGFSSAHRSYKQSPVSWELFRSDVDRTELKPAQIVVTTHAMAKVWMENDDWPAGKNFDLVICDEYPDPVKADTITLGDIEDWEKSHYDESRSKVLAEVLDWAFKVYREGMALKPTWLEKIDRAYPERLQNMVKAIKAGRMFATKSNQGFTVLQWADLAVPFEDKAIIFSATNDVEGWQFDPNVTDRISFNREHQPTIYDDLKVTFSAWPSSVPTDNRTLGEYVGASLKAIEQVLVDLPQDGEDVFVLAPKSLCDAIPQGWLETVGGVRKIFLQNWGAGIGSNAYKDCYHMVIFGLFHPNKMGLRTSHMGHSRYRYDAEAFEVGTLEDNALRIVRSNHYTRWVVQMLNRIRIRKMVSDDYGGDMYKAQAGNIVWIATDNDQHTAKKILIKNFRGCKILEATGEDVFEDLDESARVKSLKTIEERIGFILTKYEREGVDTVAVSRMAKRFDWKPDGSKARAKAHKTASQHGWEYIPSAGGHHAEPAKYQRVKA